MSVYNLVSFCGIFILIGLAMLFSANRRRMNWRAILWGTVIQLLFALFVFRFPWGNRIFLVVNDGVIKVLDAASAGSRFVFGPLAQPVGEHSLGFILAFQAFPTIVFFSALMSLLYFWGIMPLVIRSFAFLFTKVMRISGAESLCAASNIFVGVESALVIKPHLAEMTASELCTVLTAGMATVASNVMAVYVFSLKAQFPAIAGHLISASILSAPAAILMAKILMPEEGVPKTLGIAIHPRYEKEGSMFETIIRGANDGLKLVGGIVALLLAVLGLVAVLDMLLIWLGGKANLAFGLGMDWSLRSLLGYVFYPLTVITGVPLSDAMPIARIIGERTVVTEVTSYQDLATAIAQGAISNPRLIIIATYALCGFAHVASVAIFVGGTAALAPSQTPVLARLGMRALFAATLACLMTACVAGTFVTGQSILFSGR